PLWVQAVGHLIVPRGNGATVGRARGGPTGVGGWGNPRQQQYPARYQGAGNAEHVGSPERSSHATSPPNLTLRACIRIALYRFAGELCMRYILRPSAEQGIPPQFV